MARVQRFTAIRGGAYVWVPPEYRRRMKLLKGDHLVLDVDESGVLTIKRLDDQSIRAIARRPSPALAH